MSGVRNKATLGCQAQSHLKKLTAQNSQLKADKPTRFRVPVPNSCQAPKPPKPNKTKRKIGAHYSAQLSIIEIELKKKS
jgi:hypothetical protein